jgi:hypothetical protein
VLCTLTTVGERLDDAFQTYIDAYSTIIRALAEREQLPLIDLRRAFQAALAEDPRDGRPITSGHRCWIRRRSAYAGEPTPS